MSQFFCRAVTLLTFAVTIVVSMSSAEAGLDVGIETRLSQDAAEVFELAAESSDESIPVEIQQSKENALTAAEIGPHEGYPIACLSVARFEAIFSVELISQRISESPASFSLGIDHVP